MMRMKPDGSALEIYARGIRNTVGFDWNPADKALWFTDNGRDMLGDEVPPDELDRAPRPGMDFGYPTCHGRNVSDPELGRRRPCSATTPPAVELGPHVAALGMRFYMGKSFPEKYRQGIFIAEHGSWNRSHKIGYRVTFVPIKRPSAGAAAGMDGRPVAQTHNNDDGELRIVIRKLVDNGDDEMVVVNAKTIEHDRDQ